MKNGPDTSFTYRTFTCTNCKYTADVFGEKQNDLFHLYETCKCENCKILIECITAESNDVDYNHEEFIYTQQPVDPKCMVCDDTKVNVWDSKECKCPKCDSEMKTTRMILFVDSVGETVIL
jgi:hypothetical protein